VCHRPRRAEPPPPALRGDLSAPVVSGLGRRPQAGLFGKEGGPGITPPKAAVGGGSRQPSSPPPRHWEEKRVFPKNCFQPSGRTLAASPRTGTDCRPLSRSGAGTPSGGGRKLGEETATLKNIDEKIVIKTISSLQP